MLRILATLAFAVSFDVYLFDGKYTNAVERLVLSVYQPLGAGAAPDDIVASYSIEIFASRPTLIQRCVSLRIKSPNC